MVTMPSDTAIYLGDQFRVRCIDGFTRVVMVRGVGPRVVYLEVPPGYQDYECRAGVLVRTMYRQALLSCAIGKI